MAQNQDTGAWGEDLALAEGRRRGMRLVARNVRCRFGEIDLILRDGETLVFVEVKTRRRGLLSGLQAVSWRKRRSLEITARWWLSRRGGVDESPCRFDVCVVVPGPRALWLQNAFEAS